MWDGKDLIYDSEQAMGRQPNRCRFAIATLVYLLLAPASSMPTIAFPFNSQVPKVARINQPYLFQFSESTFAPEDANFLYSLTNQPAWLVLDSATRTLSGVPGAGDVGSPTFALTAVDEDGAAHVSCTLVVSADQAPQLEGDISEQLAADANLSSTNPATVTLLPGSDFSFHFDQDSFIDVVQRSLYYYATLTDHTPLPAWLHFDPTTLTFSGNAPQLSAFPQSFEVELIASDVAGFAGASASFTIVVGTKQLVFVPEEQDVKVLPGEPVSITTLPAQLYLNGQRFLPDALASAEATVPGWLRFDSQTLALTGTAPSQFSEQNATVSVKDKSGDTATATIHLVTGSMSLFHGTIGTLTAHPGQGFTYTVPSSVIDDPDLDLTVTLPPSANWLRFDQATRQLKGEVPKDATPGLVQATLTARTRNRQRIETQRFVIDIERRATSTSSVTPTLISSRASATNSSAATPGLAIAGAGSEPRLNGRVIAGIVIACALAMVLVFALLLCCYRRRRQDGYERTSPSKRTISRPILPPALDAITITTEVHTDIEKAAGAERHDSEEMDKAPQLALNLPTHSARGSRWSNRLSHISQASSLGAGEHAIRADSNIPEWGSDSAALHTPHDSFSVPAEMARVSRQLSQLSPSKRALKRLREKRGSQQSIGLGIDTGGANLAPRHSSKGIGSSHRKKASSLGLSATLDRSSCASMSTRNTSVLSTRPSDFPRPPTRSSYTGSRSVPILSITDADRRRSIRLVTRSDSMADDRTMEEKRQSFIRKRASTTLQSPLFAHGSRASSNTRHGAHGSTTDIDTLAAGSVRRSRRGKSQLTSYSESSSLDPAGRNQKRLSQRVRSAFAPNFPRAITRSSLGADDERTEGGRESSSGFYTTSSSISDEDDLAAEMALPRNQRAWVLPGEASPTPPPAPPTSRQVSSVKRGMPEEDEVRQKWKDRLHCGTRSSSPLSTAVAVSVADRNSLSASGKASQARRSRLSEPISLVSNDSLSRPRPERPRLVHTSSGRPVSVEEVRRLSSLKAEPETDTQAGSEQWEDIGTEGELEGTGLVAPLNIPAKEGTQRSNLSGPAFI